MFLTVTAPAIDFSTNSGMESTPKTPWSRKRKQQAKMERMREGKRARSDPSTSPSTPIPPPEPTTSGTAGEYSETPIQGTAGVNEPGMSTEEALDESLRVPDTAQPSDDGSSDSSEDRLVLRSHADFTNEKTALESLVQEKGQRAIYLPKFHCELNPIERVWGEAKRFTRSHCDYSFAGLERTIVPALESVRLDTIRKYFRKCREYMQAYREGNAGGSDVEKAVQKYKSHRRVFGNVE